MNYLINNRRNEEQLRKFVSHMKQNQPSPGDLPSIANFDIYGGIMPLSGSVGGDHITFVDFSKRFDLDERIARAEKELAESEGGWKDVIGEKLRNLHLNRHRGGILILDVKGHDEADASIGSMVHQTFLSMAEYELDIHGQITAGLIDRMNNRFYNSSRIDTYATMLYIELSDDGRARYVNGGHLPPAIWSRRSGRLQRLPDELLHGQLPLGYRPVGTHIDVSRTDARREDYIEPYRVSELRILGKGDIMLLYTDGMTELADGRKDFVKSGLERFFKDHQDMDAKETYFHIKHELSHMKPTDDISYVVVKRTG
ncbi:serine/threonine-protein phosphatase [Candidatus Woesearchaeota archaeon]|nr:serine/threonine-protein phosphatase [Candidatus Woesearchaeota archaeon]